MTKSEIAAVWETHSRADWPQFSNPNEGQLMTLDTVVGGCAVYYLDGDDDLDIPRIAILQDCIVDLTNLLEELNEETSTYFRRLRLLAELLVASRQRS
jgi:hypothetical protein